jgi:hypothetical protein
MRSIVSSNIDAAAREALQGCEPIAFKNGCGVKESADNAPAG